MSKEPDGFSALWIGLEEAYSRASAEGIAATEVARVRGSAELPVYIFGNAKAKRATRDQINKYGLMRAGLGPSERSRTPAESRLANNGLAFRTDDFEEWLEKSKKQLEQTEMEAAKLLAESPTVDQLADEIVVWSDDGRYNDNVRLVRRAIFDAIAEGRLAATCTAQPDRGRSVTGVPLPVSLARCFSMGTNGTACGRVNGHAISVALSSVRVSRKAAALLGFEPNKKHNAVSTSQQSKRAELATAVANLIKSNANLQWPQIFAADELKNLLKDARICSSEALRKLKEIKALKLPKRPIGRGQNKAATAKDNISHANSSH